MAPDPSAMPRFLPVGLCVEGRKCLVIGGGKIGTRKVGTLLKAGAVVTVVSPTVSEQLLPRIEAGQVAWQEGPFRDEHLADIFLVVAATDNQTVNSAVVRAAAERGILICDASRAERSEVIFGALLETGDVTVAVFSGGRDPSASRRTRDRIAELMSEDHTS
jgi:uroporphyrin-III C-methyltransferase/precorrin-2 dehydrogenase/sirohydrochlorin ferrochelatase